MRTKRPSWFTREYAKRVFYYDRKAGCLYWNHDPNKPACWNTRWAGKLAGTLNGDCPYVRIGHYNVTLYEHRVIFFIETGLWPDEVDHRNLDKSDNRFKNLREATTQENGFNQGLRSTNKSGFKGVHYVKKTNRFIAQMRIKGVKTNLGSFGSAEEASRAYNLAAERHHGEFMRLQ